MYLKTTPYVRHCVVVKCKDLLLFLKSSNNKRMYIIDNNCFHLYICYTQYTYNIILFISSIHGKTIVSINLYFKLCTIFSM